MKDIHSLSQENQSLRTFLRDLVAITGLSKLWIQRSPAEIAGDLAEMLRSALYLEFVYVSYKSGPDDTPNALFHARRHATHAGGGCITRSQRGNGTARSGTDQRYDCST